MKLLVLAALTLAVHSATLKNRTFCDKHLHYEEKLQCHRFNLKYYGQIYCEGVTPEYRRNHPDLVYCVSQCLALTVRDYLVLHPRTPYTLYRCNQIARLTKDKFPDCYEMCAFCSLPYAEVQFYNDESVGLANLCAHK